LADNIISTNQSTTFTFGGENESVIVLANASIATTGLNDGIDTAFGAEFVDILGSVSGYEGFYAGSTITGDDRIVLGSDATLIGFDDGILIDAADATIVNSGWISGLKNDALLLNSNNQIDNHGEIEGNRYAIVSSGYDVIDNYGTISASGITYDTIREYAGENNIFNAGTINATAAYANLYIEDGDDVVKNTGTIAGAETALSIYGGGNYISNSGALLATEDDILIAGSKSAATAILNSGMIETESSKYYAIDFEDTNVGDSLTNSGTVQGAVAFSGASALVINSGEIDGDAQFSAGSTSLRNTGEISGNVSFSGNDNSYNGAKGVVDGVVYISGSTGVFIGGAQGDTFSIGASQLSAHDQITGGASANDTLDITGQGTIQANALKYVSGFETLILGGAEKILISEELADTASGHALTIDTTGGDTVNLAPVTSTTDSIAVWGAEGDLLTAGASLDTFGFASASASTGPAYDTIAGVNFAHDKFDVTTSINGVTGINAAVTSGTLSTTSFNTDLASDLGATKLSADHAVLFTASAGSLAGDTFLVVDLNGTAGYQANSDLVIRLTATKGTLSTGNFI
jgi:hypothetical protein